MKQSHGPHYHDTCRKPTAAGTPRGPVDPARSWQADRSVGIRQGGRQRTRLCYQQNRSRVALMWETTAKSRGSVFRPM